MTERSIKLLEAIKNKRNEDKKKKEEIKAKLKSKKLTESQRLDLLEEYLGLI